MNFGFAILDFGLGRKRMNEKTSLRVPNAFSDNGKPVLSEVEGSKTCTEPRRSIQSRKWAGIFVIVLAFSIVGAVAQAQQAKKIARIGYLNASSPPAVAARIEAFLQGLRELGYVEGKNIVIGVSR
jgi:hypothetical protein